MIYSWEYVYINIEKVNKWQWQMELSQGVRGFDMRKKQPLLKLLEYEFWQQLKTEVHFRAT